MISLWVFILALVIDPLNPGGTYMVHEKPIFLSTPGLQGLMSLPLSGVLT